MNRAESSPSTTQALQFEIPVCFRTSDRQRRTLTMPRTTGKRLMKYVDSAICKTAVAAFDSIQFFNKYRPNPSFTPKWSDKPLLKSWEKSKPTLGFPRTTDSLCPTCVRDA